LLTVCAASADSDEVLQKRQHFPQADAEDMETYSVAAVCRQCNVPLRVIRGISNQAGDRNLARWQVADAMKATVKLLRTALGSTT
jgi:futalosine hydrolase